MERAWLCWQSAANPSLPAIPQTAGRICQIAGKESPYSRTKPQHLRALDSPLPNLTSRENLFHSREASRADEVFSTHRHKPQYPTAKARAAAVSVTTPYKGRGHVAAAMWPRPGSDQNYSDGVSAGGADSTGGGAGSAGGAAGSAGGGAGSAGGAAGSAGGAAGSALSSLAPPHWLADRPTRAIDAAAAINRNLRMMNLSPRLHAPIISG